MYVTSADYVKEFMWKNTDHEQVSDDNIGVLWRVQRVPPQDVSADPTAVQVATHRAVVMEPAIGRSHSTIEDNLPLL